MYEWKKEFPATALENGKKYFEKKRVRLQASVDGNYSATVVEREPYHVKILVKKATATYGMQCDCPLAKSGMKCKHMAATLYTLEHREKYPEQYLENKNTEADVQKEVSTEAEINTVSSQEVQTKIIDGNKELHTEKESAYESEYDSVDNSANISTDDLAYKSAYETVYESINPSEEKTEKVDWNNVDLKNYVYFQKDRIWKDMNFPQRIVQTAKKIIRDKKIKLEQVNVGYIEFEENVIGEVIGTGDDGKLSFPIQIRFNRDEVLNTMCQCRVCSRRLYYYL